MPTFRPSLSEMQSRLQLYLDNSAPADSFEFKQGYDGIMGSSFRATREFVEVYHVNGSGRVKVAEVGRILKSDSKFIKPGELYAEQITVKKEDKKHHPVYSPDNDKLPQQRVLGESNLVSAVRQG